MGKVNCERYKQLCSQVLHTSENKVHLLFYISKAEVTGYPTVRIYNRADDFLVSNFNSNFNKYHKFLKLSETQPVFQDYELVRKREVNDIVNLVKDILKEGEIIKKEENQKEGREEKEKEEKSLRDEL